MVILCHSIPPTHFWAAPNKSWPGGVRPFTGHSFLQFLLMTKYALLQSLVRPMICNALLIIHFIHVRDDSNHNLFDTSRFLKISIKSFWLGNRGAAHVQLSNFPMMLRHNLHRLNLLCIFFCPKGVICLQAAQSLLGKDRF